MPLPNGEYLLSELASAYKQFAAGATAGDAQTPEMRNMLLAVQRFLAIRHCEQAPGLAGLAAEFPDLTARIVNCLLSEYIHTRAELHLAWKSNDLHWWKSIPKLGKSSYIALARCLGMEPYTSHALHVNRSESPKDKP